MGSQLHPENINDKYLHLSLVLTWVRDDTYDFIDGLRTEHFPPAFLYNAAHITVFTHLTIPRDQLSKIEQDLRKLATRHEPLMFKFQSVKTWSKAVVITLQSRALGKLRSALNAKWAPSEIVDVSERRSYTPHVTIHARVSKDEAIRVHSLVKRSLKQKISNEGPLKGRAIGLELWEYPDGERYHQVVNSFPFNG